MWLVPLRKGGRPDQPKALQGVLRCALPRYGAGIEGLCLLARFRRSPRKHRGLELLLAAVPHAAEWVDAQHAVEPVSERYRGVQGEMPTPRVADERRPRPAERVEHGRDVLHLRRDVVRSSDG